MTSEEIMAYVGVAVIFISYFIWAYFVCKK